MTLIDDLEATNDVALAVTSALEQVLGVDVILAAGAQRQAPTSEACCPKERLARYPCPLPKASPTEIVLIVSERLAAISKRGPDELLTSEAPPQHSKPATAMNPGPAAAGTSGARSRLRPNRSWQPKTSTSSSTRSCRMTNASRAS